MTATEALAKISSGGLSIKGSEGHHGSYLVTITRPSDGMVLATGIGVTLEAAMVGAARKLL